MRIVLAYLLLSIEDIISKAIKRAKRFQAYNMNCIFESIKNI